MKEMGTLTSCRHIRAARIFLLLPSCMEQSPQCSQNFGPIAVSFQEKPQNVFFSKLILCNSYIICCLIRILFRYQYFDSCCGRLRDEHLLGVAFFKCLFTITITITVSSSRHIMTRRHHANTIAVIFRNLATKISTKINI